MDEELEQRLRADAAALGVELDGRIVGGLARYLELLLFWNRRVNLTAVREPEAIVDKHFVDSLAVVPHVPSEAHVLADFGSGAGFPGAVIALARPELSVVLIEAIRKKTAFLEALRRELPLPNLTVAPVRAEDWRPGAPPDVVVSRATWELPHWLEKARAWVAAGGRILAMEAETTYPLPPTATRHPYPHRSGTRAIVVMTT